LGLFDVDRDKVQHSDLEVLDDLELVRLVFTVFSFEHRSSGALDIRLVVQEEVLQVVLVNDDVVLNKGKG
jgi:hypothetical protein